MDAAKIQIKLFTKPNLDLPAEAFIPVFHTWIKEHRLPELLVDVANYGHVPHGPGVVLIGHGTDYGYDEGEGRRGLLFNRKRLAPAPEQRLEDSFRRVLHTALLLEKEPALAGKLSFATDEILVRINDRLGAPNDESTFTAVQPELAAFAKRLFGDGATLTRVGEPRQLFSVTIKAAGAPSLATLLERAGGAPA